MDDLEEPEEDQEEGELADDEDVETLLEERKRLQSLLEQVHENCDNQLPEDNSENSNIPTRSQSFDFEKGDMQWDCDSPEDVKPDMRSEIRLQDKPDQESNTERLSTKPRLSSREKRHRKRQKVIEMNSKWKAKESKASSERIRDGAPGPAPSSRRPSYNPNKNWVHKRQEDKEATPNEEEMNLKLEEDWDSPQSPQGVRPRISSERTRSVEEPQPHEFEQSRSFDQQSETMNILEWEEDWDSPEGIRLKMKNSERISDQRDVGPSPARSRLSNNWEHPGQKEIVHQNNEDLNLEWEEDWDAPEGIRPKLVQNFEKNQIINAPGPAQPAGIGKSGHRQKLERKKMRKLLGWGPADFRPPPPLQSPKFKPPPNRIDRPPLLPIAWPKYTSIIRILFDSKLSYQHLDLLLTEPNLFRYHFENLNSRRRKYDLNSCFDTIHQDFLYNNQEEQVTFQKELSEIPSELIQEGQRQLIRSLVPQFYQHQPKSKLLFPQPLFPSNFMEKYSKAMLLVESELLADPLCPIRSSIPYAIFRFLYCEWKNADVGAIEELLLKFRYCEWVRSCEDFTQFVLGVAQCFGVDRKWPNEIEKWLRQGPESVSVPANEDNGYHSQPWPSAAENYSSIGMQGENGFHSAGIAGRKVVAKNHQHPNSASTPIFRPPLNIDFASFCNLYSQSRPRARNKQLLGFESSYENFKKFAEIKYGEFLKVLAEWFGSGFVTDLEVWKIVGLSIPEGQTEFGASPPLPPLPPLPQQYVPAPPPPPIPPPPEIVEQVLPQRPLSPTSFQCAFERRRRRPASSEGSGGSGARLLQSIVDPSGVPPPPPRLSELN